MNLLCCALEVLRPRVYNRILSAKEITAIYMFGEGALKYLKYIDMEDMPSFRILD